MEKPVPPPVTIAGGPGWVLGPSGASDGDQGQAADAPPARSRGSQLVALVAAFAVGFATSQVLSDQRQASLSRSPEGRLSLALDGSAGPDYVTDPQGRLAVALSLEVRNTGPVDVVLESATVGGLTDAGVEGRTLLAGGLTRISLTRAVDCASLPPAAVPVGPLVVRARTPGGSSATRLPLADDSGEQFAERLREACGQVPAQDALGLDVAVLRFDGDTARLPLAVRNSSAHDVVVTAIRLRPGLRLELLDDAGAPVRLPLRLPAADYAVPRAPDDPRARTTTRLTAVLTLTGCDPLPADAVEQSLLELSVEADGRAATVPYGDGRQLLRRLTEAACPA